jgi:uncharacterized protein (DUF885 family)
MHRRQFLTSSLALAVAGAAQRPACGDAPRLASFDVSQLSGRDRYDFATVAWPASISREIAAQRIGTVGSYSHPVPCVLRQLTGAVGACRLRDAARGQLKARFDLRGFHDAVLRGRAMPLEVLEQVVSDWARSS